MKFHEVFFMLIIARRSPCGERGLKSLAMWCVLNHGKCRSPCGERGLKSSLILVVDVLLPSLPLRGAGIEIAWGYDQTNVEFCRSPCGERGLKLRRYLDDITMPFGSLPVRGAWIEIASAHYGGWRKSSSLPVRGAWIEIAYAGAMLHLGYVAPRAGSVD